jgi:hypothetical protein
MKIEISFQETNDRAKAQLTEFLVFLDNQKENKLVITIDMNEPERLALEFYAYQNQVRVEDLIDAAIRSHFQRFFDAL